MSLEIPEAVERIIFPYRDRAILYLEAKHATDTGKVFMRILEMPKHFERMVRDFKTSEEIENEKQQNRIAQRNLQIKKSIDRLNRLRPNQYFELTAVESPRPRQFEDISKWLIEDHGEGQENSLLIHGRPGTGKTAAAWAMLETFLSKGYEDTFEFVKSPTFFRLAKTKHLGHEQYKEFSDLFQRMIDTEILVLDDFGSELVSLGSSETAFELIDARTEDDRFTLITTNSTPEALCNSFSVDERIENANKMRRRINDYFHIISFDKEL